jgi:signal transduction histidine kinase
VDLNEIIGEALRSLNVAQEPGIEVQKELTTVTPIPLYRSDFRRIVENLLRNAVDAMPNGGKLLIATEMAGNDRVRIIVQDTGCGMSKEFLEKKLFQPFATTKRKGMGLGLYAAWETIKECGGTLDVQSQTGVGTTITISLPVRPR